MLDVSGMASTLSIGRPREPPGTTKVEPDLTGRQIFATSADRRRHVPDDERLSAPLILEYPFTRTTGPVIGAFMTGLREGVICGARRSDGSVLVPPAEYDPETAEALTEIVEVGQAGEVVSWTWVNPPRQQSPWEAPHALALIKLDGADTPFLHGVLVAEASEMSTGMRVQASWRDEREGHISDIAGFVPEEVS